MGAVGEAATPDGCNALAFGNRSCALGQHRRDKPKVTVNANEPGVLYQDFKSSDPMTLNPDDLAGRNR
jgi:hypothetical protein